MSATDPLDSFRAALLADAALQRELDAAEDFASAAVARARAHGIALAPEMLAPLLRDDPLGLARFLPAPLTGPPLPGWLPVAVAQGPCLDWAYFGDRRLRRPFFDGEVRAALARPLNRVARYRTVLDDLPRSVAGLPEREPAGFIFHMSRCGSTLVSQMLAADPGMVVLSEPDPLDVLLRITHPARPGDEVPVLYLRAMMRALCHARGDGARRVFVKFNCWHALALPLIRRAFPRVPWVFLSREPAAVLASQLHMRGIETLPESIPPAVFGLAGADMPPQAYCAQVLARICGAALEAPPEGGLFVDYSELPGAVTTRILPHFGIAAFDAAALDAAARFDAKVPSRAFTGDAPEKQRLQTADLRSLAAQILGSAHTRLLARR